MVNLENPSRSSLLADTVANRCDDLPRLSSLRQDHSAENSKNRNDQ